MTIHSQLVPLLDGEEATRFDAFLQGSPFAAYQQSRAWPRAAPQHARRDWRFFAAFDDAEMIGACVIRSTRLAMGAWLATVQRGPIVHDAARLGVVLGELRRVLRQAGCCSVQIGPRVRGRTLPIMAEAMRDAGFAPMPPDEQALHHATGIIWLDKPEAEVLAGLKQRARRALKAADKGRIVVRAVEHSDDLATYQRLLDAFAASRPDYDRSGQPNARAQADLIAALGGAMLLAEREGSPIGAHAFVRQADEAIWLSLATVDRDGASPGYPLLWEGMRRARAMGCVGFDLAGLPEAEPTDPGEAGRAQFKNAFAPHRRLMPPMQFAALDPVRHTVLLGARRIYRTLKRRSGAGGG
ncbi:lipid II:glycine glycyltransferase FemX [Sphingomonas radiodurans]|uniref:lipid II:glycine glycyltransferase FemX n=1 Tax=Sphingomonas radiodurans TaxID=2890321 RepID=UPI001E3A1AF9|nr:peptidoglycan bridge formation glycyltransferase FemA/FemB family protein [Sphingomonas radiodurans]WBH17820.1 peptidoglycan bridge formation glycyltransferase FemA/FemB family protein [Sphingomonas radiodurans]